MKERKKIPPLTYNYLIAIRFLLVPSMHPIFPSRPAWWVGFFAVLLAGCPETFNVTSIRLGAMVMIESARCGAAPAILVFEGRAQPDKLSIAKEGFQTETVEFTPGTSSRVAVSPEGRVLGISPSEGPLTFQRTAKTTPLQPLSQQLALTERQTATRVLLEKLPPPEPFELNRLKIEPSSRIATRAAKDCLSIVGKASLSLEGKPLAALASTELPLGFSVTTRASRGRNSPFVLRFPTSACRTKLAYCSTARKRSRSISPRLR